MEQIIQLIYSFVTVALMAAAFYFGYIFGKKERREPAEVSEEQKQKVKQFNESFQKLMNYDVEVATGRRADS